MKKFLGFIFVVAGLGAAAYFVVPTLTAPPTATPPPAGTLAVHFIDVGQGDSILIDYGQIEVLIDAGDKSPGVVDYLKSKVDGPLEAMIATHPHAETLTALANIGAKVYGTDKSGTIIVTTDGKDYNITTAK